MKRYRRPNAKEGEVKMQWGNVDGDIGICSAWRNPADKCDSRLLYYMLCSHRYSYDGKIESSFVEELEKRGYDLTTFKFSIQKKKEVEILTKK